jgi:hypothetical protein
VSTCDPITLDDATEMVATYLAAAKAVGSGQEYTIDGRSLKRANLPEINKALAYWRGQAARLCVTGSAGPTVRRGIPHG